MSCSALGSRTRSSVRKSEKLLTLAPVLQFPDFLYILRYMLMHLKRARGHSSPGRNLTEF